MTFANEMIFGCKDQVEICRELARDSLADFSVCAEGKQVL